MPGIPADIAAALCHEIHTANRLKLYTFNGFGKNLSGYAENGIYELERFSLQKALLTGMATLAWRLVLITLLFRFTARVPKRLSSWLQILIKWKKLQHTVEIGSLAFSPSL
jgi:hypothetical protein